MNYLNRHGTRQTPQSQRIPGRTDQVENNAGGYVFATDKWQRLNRFLILGSEGATYYASERTLTTENVTCVHECIAEDGIRAVRTIRDISDSGRAPKNEPALFALAVAISASDPRTRRAAAETLPQVARIGTHLYTFITYAETMRGWGSTLRWAVANWYNQKPADKLAYDVIKYRQRNGWSHRDALRLAHPKGDREHDAIYDWVTHGLEKRPPDIGLGPYDGLHQTIAAYEEAQRSDHPQRTAQLVRDWRLPREALKTEHLNDPDVWRAMLETNMPLTAMTRNLATMTRNGTFDDSTAIATVLATLGEPEKIRKARVHPMQILTALVNYQAGHGDRSSNTWKPIMGIIDALDAAFYLAFDNVAPTGKPTLIGLDVSPSMGAGRIAGSQLTPRLASVAMALITIHAEPNCEVMAFAGQAVSLPISKRQRIDDVLRMTSGINWARTDCSLPFRVSKLDGTGPHNFAVYTDNETWSGAIQPAQALKEYRERSGIDAKSAVIGMTSTGFTIADPRDAGMMDFVGFDAAAPAVMSEFFRGNL